ncbi:hypothetical protein JYT61_01340 [bacterium AH-315-E10]|nr:hypothetical protein [bacterium AH-315-E10]
MNRINKITDRLGLFQLTTILVVAIEAATAIGAMLGVAFLDPSWLGGLGIMNMMIATVVALIPAVAFAMFISCQGEISVVGSTVTFCGIAFLTSCIFSYLFGLAMVR